MSRRARGLALALGLCAAALPSGAEDGCAECRAPRQLARIFVPPEALGGEWDTVAEAPADPGADPELRAAGVRAQESLHYTRPLRGGSQVCSVELWAFATPEQARATRAQIARDGWRFSVQGDLLVMLRGVTFERGRGFRPGLAPECERLAGLIERRAVALGR